MSSSLLITPHLPSINQLVVQNLVVSITAATGSGKSVGIPNSLAIAFGGQIFITVPTRTAAISLANYQRQLVRTLAPTVDPNTIVGYAAESVIEYTPATRIVYATGGHARRKMLSYFRDGKLAPTGLDFCSILMVDEVHSGSLDNTVILSLWRYAANLNSKAVPRLIIASATPIPIPFQFQVAEYSIEVQSLPITLQYEPESAPTLDIEDSTGPLYSRAAEIANAFHREHPATTGHILIFVPGEAEINQVTLALTPLVAGSSISALILPAYGALSAEDLSQIYRTTTPTERKIVIATNIAEMSITISDIGLVVDTMAERRQETSENGGTRLITHYISKDSAKQRMGRTGRTLPGVCYRVCTQAVFDGLEEHRPPEIERVPIYEPVIEVLSVGLNPEEVLLGATQDRIAAAVEMLHRLDLVSVDFNGHRAVNAGGHFAAKFPLSVRNAAFLWRWATYGGGRRFNSETIAAARRVGLNYNYFEIVPSSEIYSLRPWQVGPIIDIYTRAFQELGWKQSQITSLVDATANVGGDTVLFAKMFPQAQIVAIESDPETAIVLRRNLDRLPYILNTSAPQKVIALQMAAEEYFYSNHVADIVYFDPPWGPNYREPNVELSLGKYPLGTIVGNILGRGLAKLIVVKVPPTMNLPILYRDVNAQVPTVSQVYSVMNDTKMDYQLIFFLRDPGFQVAPFQPDTTIPSGAIVPLISNQHQLFPGVVLASILDAYGPSYFYFPRRDRNPDGTLQSFNDYREMIERHIATYFEKYRGYSDLETFLRMWIDLMQAVQRFPAPTHLVMDWARNNSMNGKKIRELVLIVNQSLDLLGSQLRLKDKISTFLFEVEEAVDLARPILKSVYADSLFSHRSGLEYVPVGGSSVYRLEQLKSVNGFSSELPSGVIGISTVEIDPQPGAKARNIISFGVDVTIDRGTRASSNLEQILQPWFVSEGERAVPYARLSQYSAKSIVQVLEQHQVGFPFRRGYRGGREAEAAIEGLARYQPTWMFTPFTPREIGTTPFRLTFQFPGQESNQSIWMPNQPELYQTMDWIPDFYIEGCRLQCSRSRGARAQDSPLDAWNKYGTYVESGVAAVLKAGQDLTASNLREALYLDKRFPECNHEKVSMLKSLIAALGISKPRVFDGAAGWGDRLIASILAGAEEYLGVDPNECTQPGFQQMVADISGKYGLDGTKYRVLPLSMPDAVLPVELGSFDLAFLSPPSFNSEVYGTSSGQSITRWSEERGWYLSFLFPTLDRCWSLLRPGGYLIVQSILISTIAPYINYKFVDAFYCGPIGSQVGSQYKGLWIWHKQGSTPLLPSQDDEKSQLTQAGARYILTTYPELAGLPAPTNLPPARVNVPPARVNVPPARADARGSTRGTSSRGGARGSSAATAARSTTVLPFTGPPQASVSEAQSLLATLPLPDTSNRSSSTTPISLPLTQPISLASWSGSISEPPLESTPFLGPENPRYAEYNLDSILDSLNFGFPTGPIPAPDPNSRRLPPVFFPATAGPEIA